MINGKRHILRPGGHLVVPAGTYHTVGNPTAEVGHAIAAFRPAMNIHQFFMKFFEAFRTSRGLKRQVGCPKCYTATLTTSGSASPCSYSSLCRPGYRCAASPRVTAAPRSGRRVSGNSLLVKISASVWPHSSQRAGKTLMTSWCRRSPVVLSALLCLYRGSMDVEYWHVDVFSRYAFQGNGLVVVRDDVGLSTAVQQQLTREVRQFETVFISGVDLLGRTARLRIFTEDEELGFAGHPVLGVGAVLHSELSAAAAEETWALELSSRIVSVLTRGRDGWIEASMDQGPARFGMNVTGELTDRYRRALGLPLAAVRADLPMQVVSTGLPYLIVPVHAQGLATAHIATPDFEAILAASGAKFVYVLDPATPEGRTWDNTGRIEDVATGSAAGPAAAYLIEHRVHPADVPLRLAQGRFTGRPSTIEVRREPGDGHYWVGGPVAPVASGRFHARLAD